MKNYKTLGFVIGSLVAALLFVYAIRINFWYERDPIVLDIPKTTLMDADKAEDIHPTDEDFKAE